MTKKDYVLIATGIKKAMDRAYNIQRQEAVWDTAVAIAGELEKQDKKFNRYLFYDTCGWDNILKDKAV